MEAGLGVTGPRGLLGAWGQGPASRRRAGDSGRGPACCAGACGLTDRPACVHGVEGARGRSGRGRGGGSGRGRGRGGSGGGSQEEGRDPVCGEGSCQGPGGGAGGPAQQRGRRLRHSPKSMKRTCSCSGRLTPSARRLDAWTCRSRARPTSEALKAVAGEEGTLSTAEPHTGPPPPPARAQVGGSLGSKCTSTMARTESPGPKSRRRTLQKSFLTSEFRKRSSSCG